MDTLSHSHAKVQQICVTANKNPLYFTAITSPEPPEYVRTTKKPTKTEISDTRRLREKRVEDCRCSSFGPDDESGKISMRPESPRMRHAGARGDCDWWGIAVRIAGGVGISGQRIFPVGGEVMSRV